MPDAEALSIDGHSLSIEAVVAVARHGRKVRLAESARDAMLTSREYVDDLVHRGDKAVYGINTGLGIFANRRISTADTARLSRNLVLSHAVGLGEPFPEEVVRAAMLIRANTLALGHSGVRPIVVETLLRLLNADVCPLIPDHGSLGSSGDLAPLCHLALAFTCDGDQELHATQVLYRGQRLPATDALRAAEIEPIELGAKEGLALSNGTSFSAALAALALADGERLVRHAELGTALVFEALLGVNAALDPRLHEARRHQGQRAVAARLRDLLSGSTLVNSDDRVQDAYSLRCVPQILGPIHDTLAFVRVWVEDELNAATDNPLLFRDGPDRMQALSGGNFHGEVLALGADYLSIALTEVAALAERQINRLLDSKLSAGLPAMLVCRPEDAGLNSGLMMPHYTAVSLTLENQTLSHPDSVHSLPTSAGQEDVNANSLNAARNLRTIATNVEYVLTVLVFTAAQAITLRLQQQPAARLAPATERAYLAFREEVPVVTADRYYQPDLLTVRGMLRDGRLLPEAG